jgi:hypothetical protein
MFDYLEQEGTIILSRALYLFRRQICIHFWKANADISHAKKSAIVTVEGLPSALRSLRLEGAIMNLGSMRANPDNVLAWLHALRFLHPLYYDIDIRPFTDTDVKKQVLRAHFSNNITRFSSNSQRAQDAAVQVRSDITRPSQGEQLHNINEDNFDVLEELQPSPLLEVNTTYLIQRFPTNESSSATLHAHALQSIRATVESEENILAPKNTPSHLEINAEHIPRQNDTTGNDDVQGCFPSRTRLRAW